MLTPADIKKFKAKAQLTDRYQRQIRRLRDAGIQVDCIEEAVSGVLAQTEKVKRVSLVVYGEPQSGKTEMMICLTAKLLDEGCPVIVHLLNDSVDLLGQNLRRFERSGLAPAPRSLASLLSLDASKLPKPLVVFCKKNAKDLGNLIKHLKQAGKVTVIDDEADYATPNSKINLKEKTSINKLVEKLIGNNGSYVGVTATPARLDLNNTLRNDIAQWVTFRAHAKYQGQDVFFPLDRQVGYRLVFLKNAGDEDEARDALVRFLVTAAHLNTRKASVERNFTMLVHTSGSRDAHEADRVRLERLVRALISTDSPEFDRLVSKVHEIAEKLFPSDDADRLTEYVLQNASRAVLIVLNSKRDRASLGSNATEPSSPFTIIIGGNIVSRGVTFSNLLSMYFTRNVKHKLQQDTYIQRARMFGARGDDLPFFELAIPKSLYSDWHRCFVLHRLALSTITKERTSPVWISDTRVSAVAPSSVDKATVNMESGEMSFSMFRFSSELDDIVKSGPSDIATLEKLREKIGNEAFPEFVIDYIKADLVDIDDGLAIHTGGSIAGRVDAEQEEISRRRGFIGNSQMELGRFPNARHDVKIFFNGKNRARLFYKFRGNMRTMQND